MSTEQRDAGGPPPTDGPSDEAVAPRLVLELDTTSVLILIGVALGAAALLAVVHQAPSMLARIFVGVVLALALDPVVTRVHQRMGWRRGTAVALIGTGLGIAFFSVLLVLGPRAIDQASSLRRDLPTTVEDAYSWPIVGERLAEQDAANRVRDAIRNLPAELSDRQITRFAEDLLGGLLTTIVVLVTAVVVMLDGAVLVNRVQALVDGERRAHLDSIGRVVYRTFGNYFAGSLFVAVLNGFVVLTLALSLGIPLAPLAALWSMLTNLIPQVGGFLGASFLVLLAFTQGPLTAAIALVVIVAYQNFENNVIQPAVVGRAVDLTPPTTMLAALVGGAVAGVPGALVATPIVGAVKVLYLRQSDETATEGDVPAGTLDVASDRGGLLRRTWARILHR